MKLLIVMTALAGLSTAILAKEYESTGDLIQRARVLYDVCYANSVCDELNAIYRELGKRNLCIGPKSAPRARQDWRGCGPDTLPRPKG